MLKPLQIQESDTGTTQALVLSIFSQVAFNSDSFSGQLLMLPKPATTTLAESAFLADLA